MLAVLYAVSFGGAGRVVRAMCVRCASFASFASGLVIGERRRVEMGEETEEE